MDELDDDAELLGIDHKVWAEFRGMVKKETPIEPTQPPKMVQGEFESITGPVDDKEAKKRHLKAVRDRWFAYYRKCKGDKSKIIDQFNRIALMKDR